MQFKADTKILIASPTYDGNVRSEYMRSVMRLTDELRERDVAWRLLLESATLLHTMRSGSIPLSSKQGNGREWRGNQEESKP